VSDIDSDNYAVQTRNYWMSKGAERIVAKGGVQTVANDTDAVVQELTRMFLNIESSYKQRSLTTIQQFLTNEHRDLVMLEFDRSKNWDYDFKRWIDAQSVSERTIQTDTGAVKKICYDTVPFRNIDDYSYIQEMYVKFLKSQRNINKIQTVEDYKNFLDYIRKNELADTHADDLYSIVERKVIIILLIKGHTAYSISKMLKTDERKVYKIETSKNYREIRRGGSSFKKITKEAFDSADIQQVFNRIILPVHSYEKMSVNEQQDLIYYIRKEILQRSIDEVYHSVDYFESLVADSLTRELDEMLDEFNAGKLSS